MSTGSGAETHNLRDLDSSDTRGGRDAALDGDRVIDNTRCSSQSHSFDNHI